MKTHSGRQEALQEDRQGQAARAARLHEPHPREEERASASATSAGRSSCRSPTRSASRSCCTSEPRQALSPRAQEAPRHARAGQGLPRPDALELQAGEGGAAQGRHLRLPRPPQPQARLPQPVDPAHQRSRAPGGHELQPVHARPASWPRSSSTARCWPTSPSATPRPSDVLPRAPGRPRLPRARPTPNSPGAPCEAPFFVSDDQLSRQRQAQDDPQAPAEALARRLGLFAAEGEDLVEAAELPAGSRSSLLRAGRGRGAGAARRRQRARLGHARDRRVPAALVAAGRRPVRLPPRRRATPATSARSSARRTRSPTARSCSAPDCADPYSPKAVRASMGSIFARPPARARFEELDGTTIALDAPARARARGRRGRAGPVVLVRGRRARGPARRGAVRATPWPASRCGRTAPSR